MEEPEPGAEGGMTRKNIVTFPGNPNPIFRRSVSATVIVLPVIRIERFVLDPTPHRKRRRLQMHNAAVRT
jgi:hypothetical protein